MEKTNKKNRFGIWESMAEYDAGTSRYGRRRKANRAPCYHKYTMVEVVVAGQVCVLFCMTHPSHTVGQLAARTRTVNLNTPENYSSTVAWHGTVEQTIERKKGKKKSRSITIRSVKGLLSLRLYRISLTFSVALGGRLTQEK